jgi:hypothetical protein
MFEKLAKFRPLQTGNHVPVTGPVVPANDNRLRAADHAGCRPRLVCRWSAIDDSGRLGCRWEIESHDGSDDSLGRRTHTPIHKTVVDMSHQQHLATLARLTDSPRPVGKSCAPARDPAHVLHACHSPMPSDGKAATPACNRDLQVVNCA